MAAVDRLVGLDPPPPEIESWPRLTAAVDAEFATCQKWLDVRRQEWAILRRPRPCGHPATDDREPDLTCAFCVILTYTVRLSRDLRWHELKAEGNQFMDWTMARFANADERHAYAQAYQRWINDQETEYDITLMRACGGQICVSNASASSQVRALAHGGVGSTPSASAMRQHGCVSSPHTDALGHVAMRVDSAGGSLAKTAAEWGRMLNLSSKATAALLRDAAALDDYSLEMTERRGGHDGKKVPDVRRITARPETEGGA